jgi:dolichol-phosphate mannosyltransferase
MRISIIIPTYNERENILKLIPLINTYLRGVSYEVIIVDDNSPDGTATVAEALSAKYPIRVVKRPGKMGLTSAIYDGIKVADGDAVVVMDADLQHPPSLLPRLIKRLEECDVVVASRYVKGGGVRGLDPLRYIISLGATLLARLLIAGCRRIRDPVSGFFAARREVITAWKPIEPRGYKALVEVLSTLRSSRVCEEPYIFERRASGESKLTRREIFSYIRTLYKLNKRGFMGLVLGGIILLIALIYVLISLFNP